MRFEPEIKLQDFGQLGIYNVAELRFSGCAAGASLQSGDRAQRVSCIAIICAPALALPDNQGIHFTVIIVFERYTEKVRRVIFFAGYEASQYGSPVIAPEHLLFGLLREDRALLHRFVGGVDLEGEIRTAIERVIIRGKMISTSVEVPLNAEARQILQFAGEEAERLGNRHVGTEHMLLAILRLPDWVAATPLIARGAKADAIRQQIALSLGEATASRVAFPAPTAEAQLTLDAFLAGLQGGCGPQQLGAFFDERGQFIDSSGKRWIGRKEIEKGAETFLAPFAKRNARFSLEGITQGPSQALVASVLWEFAAVSGGRSKSMLRMSIVLASAGAEWSIVLSQLTPLVLGLEAAG